MVREAQRVIDKLAERAAAVGDSGDAMRLSQAACNVANAYLALATLKREGTR